MYHTDETGFEKIVAWAIDSLPKTYIDNLKNVAITIEDEPTPYQLRKQRVGPGSTLFGLYEGIPRPERNNSYSLVIPDRITIFKNPIERWSNNLQELIGQVRKTVWHEIAHHYGLNHTQIHRLENKTN